jgi:hypothetical protein
MSEKKSSSHRLVVDLLSVENSNTTVGELRLIYGGNFAGGYSDDMKLSVLLTQASTSSIANISLALGKPLKPISREAVIIAANTTVQFGEALKRLADK